MVVVVISLLSTVFFIGLSLLVLNYTIYLWESKRVDDLVSKIKPAAGGVLGKTNASRSFTSVDMGDNLHKSQTLQPGSDTRKIVSFQENYNSWGENLKNIFSGFRKNFWRSFKQLIAWLSSLSKNQKTSVKTDADLNQTQDVNKVIDKVRATNQIIQVEEEKKSNLKSQENKDLPNSTEVSSEIPKQTATINFAKDSEKDEKDMTLFEKLENKILQNLKEQGLNHYDIWLDLARLYEKYEQKDKAVEIYSLVLKHSQANEKDFARDRLIALS